MFNFACAAFLNAVQCWSDVQNGGFRAPRTLVISCAVQRIRYRLFSVQNDVHGPKNSEIDRLGALVESLFLEYFWINYPDQS